MLIQRYIVEFDWINEQFEAWESDHAMKVVFCYQYDFYYNFVKIVGL